MSNPYDERARELAAPHRARLGSFPLAAVIAAAMQEAACGSAFAAKAFSEMASENAALRARIEAAEKLCEQRSTEHAPFVDARYMLRILRGTEEK